MFNKAPEIQDFWGFDALNKIHKELLP